ncbi:MAG: Ig-like domain-containing protein, partial [candidate division WOR-3 bacterium]
PPGQGPHRLPWRRQQVTGRAVRCIILFAALCIASTLSCPTDTDTTKPEVHYVYPGNNDTLHGDTFSLKVLATDNKGIYFVQFMDGTVTVGIDSRGQADTFSCPWEPDTGWHFLKAVAYDRAGNWAGAPWITVWTRPARDRE